jgi:hypothetical protein
MAPPSRPLGPARLPPRALPLRAVAAAPASVRSRPARTRPVHGAALSPSPPRHARPSSLARPLGLATPARGAVPRPGVALPRRGPTLLPRPWRGPGPLLTQPLLAGPGTLAWRGPARPPCACGPSPRSSPRRVRPGVRVPASACSVPPLSRRGLELGPACLWRVA